MARDEVPRGVGRRGAHSGLQLLSLCLSIALWGLLVVAALCSSGLMPGTATGGHCGAATSATFLVLIIFAYAMEVALSPTRRYLNSITDSEDVISFVKRLKVTPPEVGYGIECSHLEERLETTTESKWRSSTEVDTSTDDIWRCSSELGSTCDSWRRFCGKERRKEPLVEAVVTWRATEDFEYDSWKDITGRAEWLGNRRYTVIRLNVSKASRPDFMDVHTERLYGERRQAFLEIHRPLDKRFDLYDYVEVAGYQQTMLAVRSDEHRPWWLSTKAFYVFSLLGLTWPYRQYLSFRSLEASICIKKAIQCEAL